MLQKIFGIFFPTIYKITQISGDDKEYLFELISTSQSARCSECGAESNREHSFQERVVKDLPILGESVTLFISQKRYFCESEECETSIFTEQTELVKPYYHFTERCRKYMLKVAILVSCESAAKILAYQGISVSGDTLLNMLKEAGSEYAQNNNNVTTKIGVDDWAYRKGHEYGTLICDLETREIIDVLKGRDSETLEKWLREHPEIEIVSRDRAGAYTKAIDEVLPDAIQIADRFHITKNLLEALNETMKTFMPEVVEVPSNEVVEPTAATESQIVKKTPGRSNAKPRS
jgi:transposase